MLLDCFYHSRNGATVCTTQEYYSNGTPPGQDHNGVSPSPPSDRVRTGVHPGQDTPRTGYAVGGMPFSVTQEDFLVLNLLESSIFTTWLESSIDKWKVALRLKGFLVLLLFHL